MHRQELSESITTLVQSGLVTRYHQQVGPEAQNTGSHSWGVAAILTILLRQPHIDLGKIRPLSLLQAAIFHDTPELLTGDMSHVVKKRSPDVRTILKGLDDEYFATLGLGWTVDLSPLEESILSWADMYEVLLWSRHLYIEYGSNRYWHVYRESHAAVTARSRPQGSESTQTYLRLRKRQAEFLEAVETPTELRKAVVSGAVFPSTLNPQGTSND